MRTLIIVTILMLLIFSGALYGFYSVYSLSRELSNSLEQLENHIREGRWQQADNTNEKVTKQWEKADRVFSFIIDHEQLHDLNITLSRITGLLEQKDRKRLLPEIKIARNLVHNIYEEEKPLPQNIF